MKPLSGGSNDSWGGINSLNNLNNQVFFHSYSVVSRSNMWPPTDFQQQDQLFRKKTPLSCEVTTSFFLFFFFFSSALCCFVWDFISTSTKKNSSCSVIRFLFVTDVCCCQGCYLDEILEGSFQLAPNFESENSSSKISSGSPPSAGWVRNPWVEPSALKIEHGGRENGRCNVPKKVRAAMAVDPDGSPTS